MIEFTAKIAGYAIAIKALYPETKELFRDYLSEEQASVAIKSSEAIIRNERRLMRQTDEKNSLQIEGFSDSEIESNYLYREVAEQLSQYGVVLLHGSAIAVDGVGYIFVAPSGTGKSTHTRLWREVFGNRAVMINDDKPLLKCAEGGIMVYGSPWNGKHHLSTDICCPLKAICFLNRGKENTIEPIGGKKAYLSLIKSIYHSDDAMRERAILKTLESLFEQTAFFQLYCNMDKEAARVAYEGMTKENGK